MPISQLVFSRVMNASISGVLMLAILPSSLTILPP